MKEYNLVTLPGNDKHKFQSSTYQNYLKESFQHMLKTD